MFLFDKTWLNFLRFQHQQKMPVRLFVTITFFRHYHGFIKIVFNLKVWCGSYVTTPLATCKNGSKKATASDE